MLLSRGLCLSAELLELPDAPQPPGGRLGFSMKLLSRTWVRQAHVLCEALNALKVGPLLALH
jgi:hypothetical protein